MADIVVVGSLNADLVVRAPRFPEAGETIQGEDLAIIPGGKGANQAVAAARLGARVAMVGCVGADEFGVVLIENLKRNLVQTEHVMRNGSAATGTAIILVDTQGENRIVLSPGANGKIGTADIDPGWLKGARLLLLQFEIPMETVIEAARLAKERHVQVILNPAPAREIPNELMRSIDYIVPNENELARLTGTSTGDDASLEAAAHTLIKRGVPNVIVTLGKRGALFVTKSRKGYVPAFKVKAVDTTAAGDAFIGGIAFALLEKKPLKDAVQYGCACGALATTKFGAQPSLPAKPEVMELLRSR